MTEPFWVVWNPERGLPRFQHQTFTAAKTEAERLARLHQGQQFFVLESKGVMQVCDPCQWTPCETSIPF